MPQWQGGTIPAYYFGSQLLAWLAPPTSGPIATVDVEPPTDSPLSEEGGIVGRSVLLRQIVSAERIVEEHSPDRIVVLGGDCLVDLVPFAYLSERYGDDLGILWVDAHPDIMNAEQFNHAHAMVLGNLLGEGDAEFVSHVKRPIKSSNVMYAGMYDMAPIEWEFVKGHGLKMATPEELATSSNSVLEWIVSSGIKHLAVHLDLDVLDPSKFRSLYFTDPTKSPESFAGIPQGRMSIEQVVRLLRDVANVVDVVGIGIAEHLPWDALALRDMLRALPLIGDSTTE
jgi:arginase